MKKKAFIYYILLASLVISSYFTLFKGDIPWENVWEGTKLRVFNGDTTWNPLLDERIPRLIVLLCTGASLAVAGAILQSLFHNPLASPSVLGISCGGSLAVTFIFIIEGHLYHPYAVPLAAFSGCMLTLLLVYFLSRRSGQVHITTLILTGIAISTLLLAFHEAITYALRDHWQLMQTLKEWEAGSTADRSWKHVHLQLPLTIVGLIGCWRYRHEVNILALGEEEAHNLGVEVDKVRWRLFLSISLLTSGAIAAVGIIAFFGLVLPHVIRKLNGPNHIQLIPLCMLAGSAVLVTLDTLLRQSGLHLFTIGNISAIIGGIFFLLLLTRPSQSMGGATC